MNIFRTRAQGRVRTTHWALAIGVLWVFTGFTCTDDDGNCVDYSSCEYQSAPSTGKLNFTVSEPLPVQVVLYEGTAVEDGRIVWSGIPTQKNWSITVPAGDYSATALYLQGGDTLIAVDGDYAGFSTVTTCEGTCYESDDGDLDLANLAKR